MEYSNKLLIRSSQPFLKSSSYPQQQQQFHNNRKFLTRDYYYKDSQQFFNEHVKRNYKGPSVNSASGSESHMNSANSLNSIENHINSNDNVVDATSNHLVAQHELSESWLELVLSLTFSGIIILGVVIVGVILFIWLRRHFRETSKWSKQCRYEEDKESVVRIKDRDGSCKRKIKSNNYISAYGEKKMNSRKWLGRNQQPQSPDIDSNIVDDLEQRLETVKFKNSPPTSPNNEKCSDDDDEIDDEYVQQQRQICERDASATVCETKSFEDFSEPLNDEESAKILITCPPLPVTDFHPQPPTSSYFDTASIITESKSPPSSPLTMLNEEIHNVQPHSSHTEDMTMMTVKSFKSIATSPPPFSPIIHQHHNTFSKYTTTGTQTYFTKAPNSPNNHLLNSQFAVLQTPTTSYCPTGNPFASSENKENKEPLKRCINKTITSLKQDNSSGSTTGEKCMSGSSTAQQQHVNSSPSSPSSVISTSPKILGEQNSPETKFTYSPKTASTNLSPSISSASYKFGNYFRFPDVGTPPVTEKSSSISSNRMSSMSECGETTSADVTLKSIQSMESTDKENIILKIDEVDSPVDSETKTMSSPTTHSSLGNNNNNNNNHSINNNNNNNNYSSGNTLTIRRARLKSISLDSDGARLVEENLTRPVEEIVEMTTYKPSDELTTDDDSTMTSANNNNDRINPKNIFNLKINLNSSDNSLDSTSISNDVNMNNPSNDDYDDDDESGDEICRTPTMKYFAGKKAVSLDSDHHQEDEHKVCSVKTVSTETFQYYFGQGGSGKLNNSISVPSTPKHLTSNKLKISQNDERSSHSSCSRYSQRKLGSFEENKMQSQTYKSNLTTSIQTLNVSSSNLKTLPEISSISDFEGNQSPKSIAILPRPMGIPPSKSGILQRRGSNTSLTLNLNSSCGNLTRGLSCSNYSLSNINGSNLNINQPRLMSNFKKSLLQRRGSNTSLTLNVQESNSHLNRFNSHSSLNISVGSKQNKGLLERRNSNASLTLNIQNRGLSISNVNLRGSECSLSSVNTNQMADIMMMEHEETEEIKKETQETCHQRKFLSSENLHNLSIHRSSQNQRTQSQNTPYGSIDNLKQHSQPYHQIPVICTKPLSPQTTSEDFKIYLANIQFLQSASNVLNAESLATLNTLFQNSYKTRPKVAQHLHQNQVQFYNDDVLNSKTTSIDISSSNFSPDEEQKEKLIKLHHEFWNLPTNYQEKPMVFGSQPKNRYKTILPNEHSRVILHKEEGIIQEPYINANYIKGPDFAVNPDASHAYIATQGPMTNTVYEFWLMTQQNIEKCGGNGIQKIVMLTDFVECSRQKCARYFPTELDDVVVFTNSASLDDENLVKERIDKIVHYEERDDEAVETETADDNFTYFVIKNFGVKHKNGYSIRKLHVYHGTQRFEKPKEFDVYHYWFPDWPDHRSPEDIDVLLDLSLDILDGNCLEDFEQESEDLDMNLDRSPYPIIHCSAGIGRTGCLAAILNGLRQIRSNSEEVSVDILGIVCNLRLQRGGMVQNSEQYELIHRSICLFQHKISSQKSRDLEVDDSQ